MKASYHTRQRDELLDYLKRTQGEHHTAASLKEHFAACGQPIGTATIYRRLEKMVEEGAVRKYMLETGDSACFEYVGPMEECASHFHCKCEKCGKLIHMDCEELGMIRTHLLAHHGFEWNAGRTVFYGICMTCRQLAVLEAEPEKE